MKKIEQIILDCTSNKISYQECKQPFNFILKKESDVDFLKNLGGKYFPDTEFTIPIYQRILEIEPDDIDAIVRLGELLWLDGEDEQSQEKLEMAKKIDSDSIDVMFFEVILTPSLQTKIKIYQKILDKDPTNSNALELLKQTKLQIQTIESSASE